MLWRGQDGPNYWGNTGPGYWYRKHRAREWRRKRWSTLGMMLTEKQGGGKDGENQEIHTCSTEPSPLQSWDSRILHFCYQQTALAHHISPSSRAFAPKVASCCSSLLGTHSGGMSPGGSGCVPACHTGQGVNALPHDGVNALDAIKWMPCLKHWNVCLCKHDACAQVDNNI